jgi:signal transduction histidine kinase
VIQEALANAAKHAPGSEIQVFLDVHRRGIGVCIVNAVPEGIRSLVPAGGRGVPGMDERVREAGGSFKAGPHSRGWRVRADIPLDSTLPEGCR